MTEQRRDEYAVGGDPLRALIEALGAGGAAIVAPSADGAGFGPVAAGRHLIPDPAAPPPRMSLKERLFPCTEPLFYFTRSKGGVAIHDAPTAGGRTVVVGAKPCDAASIGLLDRLFNWDYRDELFNRRKEHTVVIGQACRFRDEFCFCTALTGGPASTKGSDLFLTPLDDAGAAWALEVVTEKGAALVKPHLALLAPGDAARTAQARGSLGAAPPAVDMAAVKEWLGSHFDDPYWETANEGCLGCAQCAFTCPTCHCFDIVDEEAGWRDGRRMKNWDCCQFALFTRHASAHNPRETRAKRFRQRVNHKFRYFHERFGEVLCTGCGRCSRHCPAGADTGRILTEITARAAHP